MREHKYKVWDKKNKKLIGEGDIFCQKENLYLAVSLYVATNGIESKDVEWQQYTGLKDKNGKEIYEGDIVKYMLFCHVFSDDKPEEKIGVVKFDKKECWFYPVPHERTTRGFDGIEKLYDYEIIGNIHEKNKKTC
jgi:uncharacterized phage protein (TIGR01671 family)